MIGKLCGLSYLVFVVIQGKLGQSKKIFSRLSSRDGDKSSKSKSHTNTKSLVTIFLSFHFR